MKSKEESGSKTMTSEIATRDELKAVERWENEGGRVSPGNNLWASLKSFAREDAFREGSSMRGKARSIGPQFFRGSTCGGWSK
jgi:hypothetical protein